MQALDVEFFSGKWTVFLFIYLSIYIFSAKLNLLNLNKLNRKGLEINLTFHLYPSLRESLRMLMTHLFSDFFVEQITIKTPLSNLKAQNMLVKKLVKKNVAIVNRLSWNVLKTINRPGICSVSLVTVFPS